MIHTLVPFCGEKVDRKVFAFTNVKYQKDLVICIKMGWIEGEDSVEDGEDGDEYDIWV